MTTSQLARWWEGPTRPHSSIKDEQQFLQARLFLTIQFLFLLMCTVSFPLMIFYEATERELGMCAIAWLMSLSFVIAGRTRWYRQTVRISSILIYIWFLSVLFMFPFFNYAILYMALPLVFISLFHGVATTMAVSIVTAPVLFALTLLIPTDYSLTNLLNAIMLLCVGGGISLGTHIRQQYTRRLAERARQVEEREVRYRQLFETTPISLWVMDFRALKARLNEIVSHVSDLSAHLAERPNEVLELVRLLYVLDVNNATLKLFGLAKEEVMKHGVFTRAQHYEDNVASVRDALVAFASGAVDVEVELVLYTQTERRFNALVRWTPAPGYDPSALVMIVSVEDITARRQAEQQRIELAIGKERTQVIQRFIGDMSHDLLTPLTVIRTSAFLAAKGQIDGQAREKLDTIDGQVERVQSMVRDMLMLTRLEQPTELAFTFSPGDLEPLLAKTVGELESIAAHNDQVLVYQSSGEPLFVKHDPEKIVRALTNLVNNALKYTPRGGKIWVRGCMRDGQVIVEVEDTGQGIPAEELPQVFNRFYRAKEHRKSSGGLGLGLAIAEKIIHAHHGEITVQSVVQQGTTFRIQLPAALSVPSTGSRLTVP